MNQLSLTLFGSFSAAISSQNLRLPTDKTRALLAYLALTAGTPLRREMLAGLLWPEQPEDLARQNLRQTAARLKRAIHDRDTQLANNLLTMTRQTIELHADYCAADALTYGQHLQAVQKHSHERLEQCPACLGRLQTAVQLYRQGDLLAGFSLPDAAPFEEWLVIQRENLYQQQLAALHQLTVAFEQQGLFEEAQQYALWQIQQEPWREEAHRQLMRLLAAQGQRAGAIAQYQACRRILQVELGVEPAAETEVLLNQIMEGSLPVAASQVSDRYPHAWPRPSNQLIGRKAEMAQVLSLLAEPACRLLSVTGVGGIGKTSFVIAVGEQLRSEPPPWLGNGLYFVPLAGVANADMLPAAVSEAIGLELSQRQSIATQVEVFLKPKSTLLVLDGFEHLAGDAGWLNHLITTATQLKLVVTSREPLNWQGEWRYPLEGLSYPKEEVEGTAFEAVQLFIQAARQVQPGFKYTAGNSQAITRICQLVYGWPLALQMAAAWVRMMSCQAIAEQISAGLDFLTTSLQDVPPRHRSMRAIFEHTWASLDEEEQRTLGQLAVFHGDFSLSAAIEVAATSPLSLRGLVDKALVQYDELNGRYHLHELLRQFALEKLQADADRYYAAQQAHSHYYLRLLRTQGEALNTIRFQSALEVIREDMSNVRQAWLWAAGDQQYDLLSSHLAYMAKIYESGGPAEEAVSFFRQTIARLEESGSQEPAALIAHILYHTAVRLTFMGEYGEATTTVLAAQEIARSVNDVPLINLLSVTQALIFREQGNYEETHAVLREAIAFSQAHDYMQGVANALHFRGNTYWSLADYEKAWKDYEEGRAIYEQLGQMYSAYHLTGNMGVVLWRQGRHREALHYYEIALEAHHEAGNAASIAVWLGNTGLIYIDLHEDERAMAYLDQALKMHDQMGRKFYKIELFLGKVALFLRQGDIDTALHWHQKATRLAQHIGNRTYLLDCDLWQARIYKSQQRLAEAAELFQSLLEREFRPDASAAISQELAQLLEQAI